MMNKPKSPYSYLLEIIKSSKKEESGGTSWKKALESAVEGGRDVNVTQPETGKTILHDACAECSFEVVCSLLRLGANPAINSRANRNMLHYAALNGDPRVMQRVMAFTPDPLSSLLQRDNQQMTPFDIACISAKVETAKWLFSQYPKREMDKTIEVDPMHRTTLHLLLTGTAVPSDMDSLNQFIVEIMKKRPKYNWVRDEEQRTPLRVHVEMHHKDGVLSTFDTVLSALSSPKKADTALYMLFNPKVSPNGPYQPRKWLLLQRLCTEPMFIKFMPAAIPFVSDSVLFAHDPSGRSILHWFALYGHTGPFMQKLLDVRDELPERSKTADSKPFGINIPTPTELQSQVAFFNKCCWITLFGRSSIAAALASMKGRTNETPHPDDKLRIFDNNQDSPLHVAAKYNNSTAIVQFEQVLPGEGKSWKDADGRSALHVAAIHDAASAIVHLVHVTKCELEAKDSAGYTALMLALKEKKIFAVNALRQLNAVSEGVTSADGTDIASLVQSYQEHIAERAKIKAEKRAARLRGEEEEEEEDDDEEAAGSGNEDAESQGDEDETGSVVSHGSEGSESGGSSGSVEIHSDNEDNGPKPFLQPRIKLDCDYDEEDIPVKWHDKPRQGSDEKSNSSAASANGGSNEFNANGTKPANGIGSKQKEPPSLIGTSRPGLAKRPQFKIAHSDEYGDEDTSNNVSGGSNRPTIKVTSSSSPANSDTDSSSSGSAPTSPRSEDDSHLVSPKSVDSISSDPEKPSSSTKTSQPDAATTKRMIELEKQVEDLQKQLIASQDRLNSSHHDLKSNHDMEALKKQHEKEIAERVAAKQKEVEEKLQKQLSDSHEKLSSSQQDLESSKEAMEALKKQYEKEIEEKVSAAKKEAESKLSESAAQLAASKQDKPDENDQVVSNLREQLQEANDKLAASQKEIFSRDQLQKELSERYERLSALQNSQSDQEIANKELMTSYEKLEAQLEQVSSESEKLLREAKKAHEDDKKRLEDINAELSTKLTNSGSEASDWQAEKKKLISEYDQLLKSKEDTIMKLESSYADLAISKGNSNSSVSDSSMYVDEQQRAFEAASHAVGMTLSNSRLTRSSVLMRSTGRGNLNPTSSESWPAYILVGLLLLATILAAMLIFSGGHDQRPYVSYS